MTLILTPQKVSVPTPSYPTACTGTQRFGPADWFDFLGVWDGQHYVFGSFQSFFQLTPVGGWDIGTDGTFSTLRIDFEHGAGGSPCYFDSQYFELYDTYGAVIASAYPSGLGVGNHSVLMPITWGGFDIASLDVGDNCLYGNISIDGICFDPV